MMLLAFWSSAARAGSRTEWGCPRASAAGAQPLCRLFGAEGQEDASPPEQPLCGHPPARRPLWHGLLGPHQLPVGGAPGGGEAAPRRLRHRPAYLSRSSPAPWESGVEALASRGLLSPPLCARAAEGALAGPCHPAAGGGCGPLPGALLGPDDGRCRQGAQPGLLGAGLPDGAGVLHLQRHLPAVHVPVPAPVCAHLLHRAGAQRTPALHAGSGARRGAAGMPQRHLHERLAAALPGGELLSRHLLLAAARPAGCLGSGLPDAAVLAQERRLPTGEDLLPGERGVRGVLPAADQRCAGRRRGPGDSQPRSIGQAASRQLLDPEERLLAGAAGDL
ncbi:uncharacterized protein LOC125425085 isoform X2 [Sphaerodactylus townsendi]|nr:uncharacterized protein LOC125425085 isoform X2 [Sphaerodactylus townsendi]XP_048338536.1 uncharacterized protein LOC125425085 isoform X2 [Sphaerodactylus townsendi]XP_048338537.1 uncharacterized protein LOC125425085 isoform X2 [Sphaerodactylus townsendi]XP_048338539.1 uncharacterized protein LOC125425085 isoform X2 [Sphaerodactylus townsendi]